jgi:hypothetical protein
MRKRALAWVEGKTKTVSDKFICRASACMDASDSLRIGKHRQRIATKGGFGKYIDDFKSRLGMVISHHGTQSILQGQLLLASRSWKRCVCLAERLCVAAAACAGATQLFAGFQRLLRWR